MICDDAAQQSYNLSHGLGINLAQFFGQCIALALPYVRVSVPNHYLVLVLQLLVACLQLRQQCA